MRISPVALIFATLLRIAPAFASGMNSYRAVELGAGSARITTDGAGNSVVLDSTGQSAYYFPRTNNRVSTDLSKALPPVRIDFSSSTPVAWNDAFRNQSGEVVSALSYTVYQPGRPGPDVPMLQIDAFKGNGDGSYGHIDRMFGTPIYNDADPALPPFASYIADFNNRGQLVYQGLAGKTSPSPFQLIDIHSPGSVRNLDALLQDAIPGSHDTIRRVAGLDDQGRILVYVGSELQSSLSTRPVLLVPEGLPDLIANWNPSQAPPLDPPSSTPTTPIPLPPTSGDPADTTGPVSNPDATPVPEPTTFLIVAGGLAVAGWARRRRSSAVAHPFSSAF